MIAVRISEWFSVTVRVWAAALGVGVVLGALGLPAVHERLDGQPVVVAADDLLGGMPEARCGQAVLGDQRVVAADQLPVRMAVEAEAGRRCRHPRTAPALDRLDAPGRSGPAARDRPAAGRGPSGAPTATSCWPSTLRSTRWPAWPKVAMASSTPLDSAARAYAGSAARTWKRGSTSTGRELDAAAHAVSGDEEIREGDTAVACSPLARRIAARPRCSRTRTPGTACRQLWYRRPPRPPCATKPRPNGGAWWSRTDSRAGLDSKVQPRLRSART